jgi:hypothetical protein
MIIRIKKRDLLIVTMFFILIALIPFIYAQTQTPKTAGVGVWLVISNQNPVNITLNNASGFAVDPVSADTSAILISFNVSDPDGAGQINGTLGGRVIVNVTLGTPGDAQFRTQSSCVNTTLDSDEVIFNCTVNMQYYDNNSANWVINITVIDSNSGTFRNASETFTYNSLAAFSLNAKGVGEAANLNFTSLNLGDQNQEAKAPLILNNTGNNDFDQINITAAALVGVSTPSETIAAASFFVNVTNGTSGNRGLPLSNSAQTIPDRPSAGDSANATLLHGPSSTGDTATYSGPTISRGNQTLIFWVNVPSSALSAQTYNNTWNITVVDLS